MLCLPGLYCRFTADEETRFLKGVNADKQEALRRLHITAVSALHQAAAASAAALSHFLAARVSFVVCVITQNVSTKRQWHLRAF
jgi:hypothetical protein